MTLTRGDVITIIHACDLAASAAKRKIAQLQRRNTKKPGVVAGLCMEAADYQMLRDRALTYAKEKGWLSKVKSDAQPR